MSLFVVNILNALYVLSCLSFSYFRSFLPVVGWDDVFLSYRLRHGPSGLFRENQAQLGVGRAKSEWKDAKKKKSRQNGAPRTWRTLLYSTACNVSRIGTLRSPR